MWQLSIGATPHDNGTTFRVWAADAHTVEVLIIDDHNKPTAYALDAEGNGYFRASILGVGAGTRYLYRVNGETPRPDPASRSQPDGVHGASQVVDPAAFDWSDHKWQGRSIEELVIYEVHVGTATPEGTFDALISHLEDIRALGITAIEIMPIADFPGAHNWGYDGVNMFAPARVYGGVSGFKRLVNAAHAHDLAVILDVVYNHFGPDGNYLRQFSRDYFTNRQHTPWGDAINFDGEQSDAVRDFFCSNACYWAHEYHLDGLRFDATHAIFDTRTPHILAEIADHVRDTIPLERAFVLIAEHGGNDPTPIRPRAAGGHGFDGIWADDLHHQVRVAVTGERDGYFSDYGGSAKDIAATLAHGWFYVGQYSRRYKRPRGEPVADLPYTSFVQCIQNHDQIGNRAFGDRLHHTVNLAVYRAVSALLLLSPATPLLFMGQEWAASTPFQYFTDHHPELGRLVSAGRRKEFAHFATFSNTAIPDPQDPATFLRSKLRWDERTDQPHAAILAYYRDLLNLRHTHPAFRSRIRGHVTTTSFGTNTIALRYTPPNPNDSLLLIAHLDNTPLSLNLAGTPLLAAPSDHSWRMLLDSEALSYGGRGSNVLEAFGESQRIVFTDVRTCILNVQPTFRES